MSAAAFVVNRPKLTYKDHHFWYRQQIAAIKSTKHFLFAGRLFYLAEFDCVVLDCPQETFRLEGLSPGQREAYSGKTVRLRGALSAVRSRQPLPMMERQRLRSIDVNYVEEAANTELSFVEIATAIDTLEQSVRESPVDAGLMVDLGYAYFRGSLIQAIGNRSLLDRGLHVLERALELNPHFGLAYNNLALIHTVLGNFQNVLEFCDRALAADPGFTTPYFGVYVANNQLGNSDAARRALERVIEIGGDSANVSHARLLLNLRNDDQTVTCRIVSCQDALAEQYGDHGFAAIDQALQDLAAVHRQKGIASSVTYMDLAANIDAYTNERASRIKSRIDEWCRDASKRGDPIEYVILVGGPDIVPFFEVPDPTDPGKSQLSDNPYASDEESFGELVDFLLPTRRVGRIPGEAGTRDPGLIITQVRNACRFHQERNGLPERIFCYTAEAWCEASRMVLEPMSDCSVILKTSEPLRDSDFDTGWLEGASYLHFNLHGGPDDESWKGTGNPAWKVRTAIGPHNLARFRTEGTVVFAQCCYGAYITGKTTNDSVSLKLLERNARCFVGSLAIAFGVDGIRQTELEESDLIARSFWTYVREGLRFGDALLRAKRDFAETMAVRAGGLDEDDQKTLLSFVLYGDPTLSLEAIVKTRKSQHSPGGTVS